MSRNEREIIINLYLRYCSFLSPFSSCQYFYTVFSWWKPMELRYLTHGDIYDLFLTLAIENELLALPLDSTAEMK